MQNYNQEDADRAFVANLHKNLVDYLQCVLCGRNFMVEFEEARQLIAEREKLSMYNTPGHQDPRDDQNTAYFIMHHVSPEILAQAYLNIFDEKSEPEIIKMDALTKKYARDQNGKEIRIKRTSYINSGQVDKLGYTTILQEVSGLEEDLVWMDPRELLESCTPENVEGMLQTRRDAISMVFNGQYLWLPFHLNHYHDPDTTYPQLEYDVDNEFHEDNYLHFDNGASIQKTNFDFVAMVKHLQPINLVEDYSMYAIYDSRWNLQGITIVPGGGNESFCVALSFDIPEFEGASVVDVDENFTVQVGEQMPDGTYQVVEKQVYETIVDAYDMDEYI